MKINNLIYVIAIFALIGTTNAQDSVIFYPTLNNADPAPGYTIQDVVFPPALAGSNFWWDDKEATRIPPSPDIYDFGYEQNLMSWAHRIRGFDKNNYYICETWFVIDPVDLSNFNDVVVTFFNMTQFANGMEDSPWYSKLDIMVSTDYSGDVTTASWDDLTTQLDTIDKMLEYDGDWVKSTLSLDAYSANSNVTFALKYHIDQEGTLTKPDLVAEIVGERPGYWKFAEVRFTGTYNEVSGISDDSMKESLLIYPNPVDNTVYFKHEPENVKIFDINGKEMYLEYASGTNSVNVSYLPKGMYIIEMQLFQDQIKYTKIVKQ